MSERGRLVVYVTSHGFGHLNRTVAVLNLVPPAIPLVIQCDANLFDAWRERLQRPATLEARVWDSGAVNPPGDSGATDPAATLERALQVRAQASDRLDDEVERLRDEGAGAVLCDAPSLPLVAARRAGIHGFLLTNFTWADIYAPFAERIGGEARRLVSAMRQEYRQAAGLFRAEPSLRMPGVAPDVTAAMIVTPGRNRRVELHHLLGLTKSDKLVYFYVGRYGQTNLGYERIERLRHRGIHFVGFHPAPSGPLANLHVVPASEWTGADLAASADVIVAKAGYGTVCEAMAARTPIIYPPRTGFAEHRALDRALRRWGGGIPASGQGFRELRLDRLIDRALALRPGPPPFRADGAAQAAEYLTRVCQGAAATRRRSTG
jgi:hypothetical protein